MLKAFFKLLFGNIFGKFIGFIREIIIAALYGITAPVGAFRIAQSATLIIVNFFTSDSLNAGFIPLYNKYKKISFRKAQSLFWLLHFILGIFSIFLSIFLFISASSLIFLIAPGFNSQQHALAVLFVKILSIGIPFYILSSLYSYLAIANNSYLLASIRPTIQSLGMICGVTLAYYFSNIALFAWGFTIAYVIFFLFSIKELVKMRLFIFYFDNKKAILKDFWLTIRPLLLLPILLQGNIVVERIVSSYLGIQVVASVEYAKFITETGIVFLAMPLGLVGLSTLSNLNHEEVKEKLLQIIPLVLIITIPISLFLGINSKYIVEILFKRGAFNEDAAFLTQIILIGLSIGFWANIASYVMIKVLNSHRRNREVIIFMGIALSLNSLFNILSYKIFGPITIGIGSSIYGIILFILAINAFKIQKEIFISWICLLIGSFIFYFVNYYLELNKKMNFVLFSILFIIYWIIYIFIVPSLRIYLVLLLNKIRNKI